MSACGDVKKWIEENVQVPVDRFVTQLQQLCEEYRTAVEEKLQQPVERWCSELRQICAEQPCNWGCLCCNKWGCWIAWVVVKIVTWVVVTVVKWVVYSLCKTVMIAVRIVEMVTMLVGKWVVTFVVCLFTEPGSAAASVFDLWSGVLDVVETVVDFGKDILEDLADIVLDVESVLTTLLSAIPGVGPVLAGIVRGFLEGLRDGLGVVRGLLGGLQDIVFGALRGDYCRALAGLAGLGTELARALLLAPRAGLGGWIGGGIRDEFDFAAVERIVDGALREVFGDDAHGLRIARNRVRLRQRPFGLPLTLDARRLFVSSRSDTVDLRALNAAGVINLEAAAGQFNDCSQASAKGERGSVPLNHPRWEVVYAGTRTPVDYTTIRRFLEEGPQAVAEFRVYAIRTDVLERLLAVAQRKGYQLGVALSWRIGEYEVTRADELPVPDTAAGNDALMARIGRLGTKDELCTIPALAVFRYENDARNGLTSWYRTNAAHPSGVTFRDRLPEWMFQYVLIHEVGHYLGLNHGGHDGLDHIMYTNDPGEGLSLLTPMTFLEYLLLSGEPRFTVADAETTWTWLKENARKCLGVEEG